MALSHVIELYNELAKHRIGEAIDSLRETAAADGVAAHTARMLELAAAALALATATYATPGSEVARRHEQLIGDLLVAAACFEQLADTEIGAGRLSPPQDNA